MKLMSKLLALTVAAFVPALYAPRRARTAAYPQQASAGPSEVALVGGRVYISPFQPAIRNGVVIIRNGQIAAAGSRGKVHVPQGIGILDCSKMYIMAGFQNSHVHFTEPKWNNAADLPADQLTQQLQEMLTRYGFTTAVDLGSNLQNTLALRQRIDSGEVLGPRILTAGTPLYPPNGVPYYIKNSMPANVLKQLPEPTSAAQAIQQVDEHVAQGAQVIKLFTGSWVARGQAVTMPLAVAEAAVTEAHKKGKLVFAHPSNVAGFQIALQSHVDVLGHAVEDTSGWSHDYSNEMRGQGMWLIPTLWLFSRDSNLDAILEQVRDYSQNHEQILFGTDAGFLTDYDPANEYVLMQRAGMDFWHILDSLTTAPALRFGQSLVRGQIKPGMNADLVIVSRDPESDIRNLAKVVFTYRDGRIIYSAVQ